MPANSPDTPGRGRPRRTVPFASKRRQSPPSPSAPGLVVITACTHSGPGVEIGMPAPFAAFCARYLDVYIRYAVVRVGDEGRARWLVQAALGDLAMVWAEALQSPSPTALAWRLLAARAGVAADDGGQLYRVLSAPQADAVLLRYRLGLSPAQAAEVMGWAEGEFACLLRGAVRTGAAA